MESSEGKIIGQIRDYTTFASLALTKRKQELPFAKVII